MFSKNVSAREEEICYLQKTAKLFWPVQLLAPESGAHSRGAFRDPIPSHPSLHPSTINSFSAFKLVYTEAFKSVSGNLW